MVGKKHWNEEEKQILKAHYHAIGNKELRQALPGRSVRSILSMSKRLDCWKSPERLLEANRNNGILRHAPQGDGNSAA